MRTLDVARAYLAVHVARTRSAAAAAAAFHPRHHHLSSYAQPAARARLQLLPDAKCAMHGYGGALQTSWQPDSSVEGFTQCVLRDLTSRGAAVDSLARFSSNSDRRHDAREPPYSMRACAVHTEIDQPARRPVGCAVVASTLAARDAMAAGEKARPTPADDKRARRFDVVHRPSRPWSLASQNCSTAPPVWPSTRHASPDYQTLVRNPLANQRRPSHPTGEPTSAKILLSMQRRTDPLQRPLDMQYTPSLTLLPTRTPSTP